MKTISLVNKEKNLFWRAEIEGEDVKYIWGRLGSEKIQEKKDFGEWKNKNRSNEVTPEINVIQKSVLKAQDKLDKDEYELVSTDIDFSDYVSKTRKEVNSEVPKPMLAHTLNEKQYDLKIKEKSVIYYQPKIDGYRMLFNRFTGECYSRSRKLIASVPHLSEMIIEATKDLPDTITWIDGEIYSDEITFSQLQSILGKQKEIDIAVADKVYFNVFDVVTDTEFSNRAELVKEHIVESKYVRLVETKVMLKPNMDKIKQRHGEYIEQGYEGIMLRLNDYKTKSSHFSLLYENKRSYGLFKYKQFLDSEYKIVDSESEEVSYQGDTYTVTKTVTFKLENGDTFKARPKMSVPDRANLWNDRNTIVGKLGKVKYQELSEYNVPRFPVLLSIREDFDK